MNELAIQRKKQLAGEDRSATITDTRVFPGFKYKLNNVKVPSGINPDRPE